MNTSVGKMKRQSSLEVVCLLCTAENSNDNTYQIGVCTKLQELLLKPSRITLLVNFPRS